MWTVVGLCLLALLVTYTTQWIIEWRNPNCKGVLPPGSMGLPLIGETLNLIIPSYSLDLHPFIKKRLQKYGLIFRTSLAGRPIIISADPEINNYLLQQEGKLLEIWYMDTFSKIFCLDGDSRVTAAGAVHKYLRHIFLEHFGAEILKEKLLTQIEAFINKTLCSWSSQESVEVKNAASVMTLNFGAEHMIGYNAENSSGNLSKKYASVIEGLMSFPINFPGTAYYNCLKEHKKIINMLKDIIKERRASPETRREDFLDHLIIDMEKEEFVTEDFAVQLVFGGLFANYEAISPVLALAFSLLLKHPLVLQELTAEHEVILNNREHPDSPLTWDEYKSMTFTLQVVNETLRLANVAPGLLRRALTDIPVKGLTIPAGWTIMLVTSAFHMSPVTFKDPLEFNPWRWKDLESHVISKNLMPFGGGTRQCAGSEYSRAFLATFLHVLVTKYRWSLINEGLISRNPMLGFGNGIHIKLFDKKI